MTPYDYLKQILRTMPEIARQTGYSLPFLSWRFFRCYLAHRVEIDEFRSLRLYDFTRNRLDQYLTWKDSKRLSDRLNAKATAEQIRVMNDKHLFNAAFAGFIRRNWLYIPDSTPEQVAAFFRENGEVFAKACVSSQGSGIVKLRGGETDPAAFFEEYRAKSFLLESAIRQHPLLAEVNPASVNTIRLIAARVGDKVRPVGAGLRTGGGGQVVDNFHHGGTAYPLDLETGVVTGRGIDLDGNAVTRHPVTGHMMPGLQVPHWDQVLDTVRRASLVVPNIGYVGWDLAVTEDGVELIEGNVNYPGNTIIQLDGPGPRKRLEDFCAAEGIAVR